MAIRFFHPCPKSVELLLQQVLPRVSFVSRTQKTICEKQIKGSSISKLISKLQIRQNEVYERLKTGLDLKKYQVRRISSTQQEQLQKLKNALRSQLNLAICIFFPIKQRKMKINNTRFFMNNQTIIA